MSLCRTIPRWLLRRTSTSSHSSMESPRARIKASAVARLLLDLAESEITPCIATRVELAHYARVVQDLMDRSVSHTVWDGLLRLLRGLSQGCRWLRL